MKTTLTVTIRYGVLWQVVCFIEGHDTKPYAVIHAAWNHAGRYCTRCGKSWLEKSDFGEVNGVWQPTNFREEPQPWASLKTA